MNCPTNYSLCGTLTIESGLGKNHYHGVQPGVHGLWPEVKPYGTSECVTPLNTTFNINDSNSGLMCNYVNETRDNFWFAEHEWTKHGLCSGTGPALNYFIMMCTLGHPIVQMLAMSNTWLQMKESIAFSDWKDYIYKFDNKNKQFLFSVCSIGNGIWDFCTASS